MDNKDLGMGLCLTIWCSGICELSNITVDCSTTTAPTTGGVVVPTTTTARPPIPPITPGVTPDCPEWDKVTNETFLLCNCTMARCIENNTIEIIPYECPPLEEITCANGKTPVLVYDENYCCQHYACDCLCEGWGDPHYITFDGLFYSYQGNCTYVLMEEIILRHHLKIYIDNIMCDPREPVSCPRALTVAHGSEIITLKNHNLIGAVQLEALKDEAPLKLPYSHAGVKVLSSGLHLLLEIPSLGVVVTFGVTGFSVNLPFKHFGKNTQGHCGTCNNNQADDCMLPSGQLVHSCALMADYWPAPHIYQPDCPAPSAPPTDMPLVPPTQRPCKPHSMCDLLKSSVFEACHHLVSPDKFYEGCTFDSCHVENPVVECTSLQAYAAACAQAGVCLHWRNHTTLCASSCPADKVYKPCGPAEPPTCEDKPTESILNFTTEGCFCPDGTKLFNKESGICVEKCGCIDAEGNAREFNERFELNCQQCVCDESTKAVHCSPRVCPAPPAALNCTAPGSVLVNQSNPADPCCAAYVCHCDSSKCPAVNTNCPVGHVPEITVPLGKCCPEHTCRPKRVCVHKNIEYEPGSSVPVVECQDCVCSREVDPHSNLFKIRCEPQRCDMDCDQGYEYVDDLDACCGRCVQTHCSLNVNGTRELVLLAPGRSWSPPGNKCERYTCVKNGASLMTSRSSTICPPFQKSNCQPDTLQTTADGCCTMCVEREQACKLGSMKTRITHGECTSEEEVDMPYCQGACNTFTKYSEVSAVLQHQCSCCQGSRSSNRTVLLRCLNGERLPFSYVHVEECRCSLTECHGTAAAAGRKRRSFNLV